MAGGRACDCVSRLTGHRRLSEPLREDGDPVSAAKSPKRVPLLPPLGHISPIVSGISNPLCKSDSPRRGVSNRNEGNGPRAVKGFVGTVPPGLVSLFNDPPLVGDEKREDYE